jgi:hypothetical protein
MNAELTVESGFKTCSKVILALIGKIEEIISAEIPPTRKDTKCRTQGPQEPRKCAAKSLCTPKEACFLQHYNFLLFGT